VDSATLLGTVSLAVASLAGAYAAVQGRRTESRSANREEVEQAFEMQGKMLENYRSDNDRLREKQQEMHDTVNRTLGKLGAVTVLHQECERNLESLSARLSAAERRLAELEA
jgi:chromosome segregation ATPase